jgi:DNA-binding CsgD family transcriptional regulator
MTRKALQCAECERRDKRVVLEAKRARIAQLWADGAPMNEIAAAIGTNRNTLGTQMSRMRAAGWELPYRHPGLVRLQL